MTQMGIGGLPSANQKEALAQKPPNKLEGVFRTMLEQRSFYPLYPNSLDVPIEWQQIEALGFLAQPDVIFTPSDLKLCAKVSNMYLTFQNINGTVCVNPGNIVKGVQSGGSYALMTVEPLSQMAMNTVSVDGK